MSWQVLLLCSSHSWNTSSFRPQQDPACLPTHLILSAFRTSSGPTRLCTASGRAVCAQFAHGSRAHTVPVTRLCWILGTFDWAAQKPCRCSDIYHQERNEFWKLFFLSPLHFFWWRSRQNSCFLTFPLFVQCLFIYFILERNFFQKVLIRDTAGHVQKEGFREAPPAFWGEEQFHCDKVKRFTLSCLTALVLKKKKITHDIESFGFVHGRMGVAPHATCNWRKSEEKTHSLPLSRAHRAGGSCLLFLLTFHRLCAPHGPGGLQRLAQCAKPTLED